MERQAISDDEFASAVVAAGLVKRETLDATRSEVEKIRAEGRLISLAHALVKRKHLTLDQRRKLESKLRIAKEKIPERFGAYRLLKKLGEGGMGSVYLAEDAQGQRLALKTLSRALAEDEEARARFKREARAASELQHPHIVRAFSVGEEQGQPYYAMEFCDGDTLEEVLDRGGRMPLGLSLTIVMQVARGLAFAHERGFVHRDIKPGNIFLLRDGQAKVMDLGLSKNLKTKQSFHTMDGTALGTPHYISPEQAMGMTDLDGRTDQYSLGSTLYHMLTGLDPFDAPSPTLTMMGHVNGQLADLREACPDAPEGLVEIMTRMLAKDPGDRYSDLNAVIDEIERVKNAQPLAGNPLDPALSSLGRGKAKGASSGAPAYPALGAVGRKVSGGPNAHAERGTAERKERLAAVRWPGYLVVGSIMLFILVVIIWALAK